MVRSDYSATMSQIVYKIAPEAMWREAERNGRFTGAPIDIADGFIHFSTGSQVRETAAKHFAGQTDLLLIAIDEARLGDALKYEVSRGGALFPHLYAPLDLNAVLWARPLPLGGDGRHQFPELEGE
ncbi:MAG: DUF952 domain-containing protein [Mesorhizobium sp.]|nr:MAG: DUF952 domain-containing protein [Mesorhizobium sp.]